MTIFGRLGTNVKELQWQPERVHLYDNNPVTLPDVAGVACGGRHSMVWLSNGNVFSFGNNFHAQLGYDYRSKNYKENQVNVLIMYKLYVTFVLSRDSHGSFIRLWIMGHYMFNSMGHFYIACIGSFHIDQYFQRKLHVLKLLHDTCTIISQIVAM